MIHTHNLNRQDKPYLTEATNGKEGFEAVRTDSFLQEDAADMTPSELLQAALASCTNMTVRGVLNKRGIPYDDIFVDVEMETVDGRTVITRKVRVVSDAPEADVNAAIERGKNSHLTKVLGGEIEIRDE